MLIPLQLIYRLLLLIAFFDLFFLFFFKSFAPSDYDVAFDGLEPSQVGLSSCVKTHIVENWSCGGKERQEKEE